MALKLVHHVLKVKMEIPNELASQCLVKYSHLCPRMYLPGRSLQHCLKHCKLGNAHQEASGPSVIQSHMAAYRAVINEVDLHDRSQNDNK